MGLIWQLATQFLFSRRAGSIVRTIARASFFAVAVSTAALVVVMSVMKALNERIFARTMAVDPHITLTFPHTHQSQVWETHPAASRARGELDWRVVARVNQDMIARTPDGRFQGVITRGLATVEIRRILEQALHTKSAQGSEDLQLQTLLKDFSLEPGEVIIGAELAHNLGVYENDLLMLTPPESLLAPAGTTPPFETVQIKAIVTTNHADIDKQMMFFDPSVTLTKFTKSPSRKYQLDIWVPMVLAQNIERVASQFANFEVGVETWKTRDSALYFALKLERSLIFLILSLAGLIALFSVVIVLGLLVSQKRREFGLLSALGLGPRKMRGLLVGMSMTLVVGSQLLGAAIGTAITVYLEHYPLNILPDIYYDSQIPASLDFSSVLLYLTLQGSFALVIAWLFALTLSTQPGVLLRTRPG